MSAEKRKEEHQAFIQSLKALINRTIDNTEFLTVGDVISTLEMEKFSMMHGYLEKIQKEGEDTTL